MTNRIIVSKQLIAQFRKKALVAYPKEYMATVWGRRDAPDVFMITSIKDVAHTATGDSAKAKYDSCVMPDGSRETWLGTIHTHPDSTDATPSQTDWDNSLVCGELLFGVMKVGKKPNGRLYTELRWWEPRAAITMIHPRVREAKKPPAPVVEVSVEAQ